MICLTAEQHLHEHYTGLFGEIINVKSSKQTPSSAVSDVFKYDFFS